MKPKEPLHPMTYRLPLDLLKRLKETAKRLYPMIRNVNHAVELALREWIERNK